LYALVNLCERGYPVERYGLLPFIYFFLPPVVFIFSVISINLIVMYWNPAGHQPGLSHIYFNVEEPN